MVRDLSIDMEVGVVVQPIKLIYRPSEIEKLINFFYVEDLKPEIKQQAASFKKSLQNQFDSHLKKSLDMHELRKRKNKVKIEVICPLLELPFSNNSQWKYE